MIIIYRNSQLNLYNWVQVINIKFKKYYTTLYLFIDIIHRSTLTFNSCTYPRTM